MDIPIWPGSSSFVSGSSTPFGFYDSDPVFQRDADFVALWCSRRLGYPIVSIELQAVNFYAAFEEAISEYGNQVNTYVSRDNLLYLLGADTGSQNISQEYVEPRSGALIKLSEEYGTVVGVGGNVTYYTGSLEMSAGKQIYDLVSDSTVTLETGSFNAGRFTIRQLHHYIRPASSRYADPYGGSGLGSGAGLLDNFGWGNTMPATNYILYPLNHDLLRIQAIEFNDLIRRSAYSFSLINNRLRIFPIPTESYRLFFDYTLDSDEEQPLSGGTGKISDYSNVPYQNMRYWRINQMGRQWIRRYTLALCKETLGYIRGKFGTLPIPDSEVTLNSADLLDDAEKEKEDLLTELKEILEQFSRRNLLERKKEETDALEDGLQKYPLGFYVG